MLKFFGGLLMAIGILVATVSGLCSARLLMNFAGNHGSGGEISGAALMIVGVVGGIPFLGGVGLFLGGCAVVRSPRKRSE